MTRNSGIGRHVTFSFMSSMHPHIHIQKQRNKNVTFGEIVEAHGLCVNFSNVCNLATHILPIQFSTWHNQGIHPHPMGYIHVKHPVRVRVHPTYFPLFQITFNSCDSKVLFSKCFYYITEYKIQ